MSGSMNLFLEKAKEICTTKNVWTDKLSRLSYGTDASFYHYYPEVIICASNEDEVKQLLSAAAEHHVPVTFRAAGTSLSGQTITESAIILIRREEWKKYNVHPEEEYISMQPGLRGGEVNAILKKHGQQIGPDPASVNSAMIGGIVANNASGMRSGVFMNSYNLLKNIRIVLADGTVLDTGDPHSRDRFLIEKRSFVEELAKLRENVMSQPGLVQKITEKYKLKNTIGYGLNSLVDFEDPIDIIAHLMVGSEGTLGFISEVSLKTVPFLPLTATSLLLFCNLDDACNAAICLNENGASAIELIDRKALQSIENNKDVPAYIKGLDEKVTALLVDFTADTAENLQQKVANAQNNLQQFETVQPFSFTTNSLEIARLWSVRKGIFPSVGGTRKPGTTVFIEDVAFNLHKLPGALADLRGLLEKYNYPDAVIYGHANDGNVHFIFSEDMRVAENVERYSLFMEEVADLVVNKYNGSLKAEHGTGRNMAPYVEKEWGRELYEIHRKIKQLFDPKGILNPGVIINDDKNVHVRNIKYMPVSDPIIDQCIECGFCEVNCLTNELNMSARQRIIAFRELQRMKERDAPYPEMRWLQKAYQQKGIDTCAGDGLCSTSCPVGIDTGQIVKKMRGMKVGRFQTWIAGGIARNMKLTLFSVKAGLAMTHATARIMGVKTLNKSTVFLSRISKGAIPVWHGFFPVANKKIKTRPAVLETENQVVYFPSCISQAMGGAVNSKEQMSQTEVTIKVLERAGYTVLFPENMSALCCGTPWESKGYFDIANRKSEELENALLVASQHGRIPVLIDTSPCLYRMRRVMKNNLEMYEPVEFALRFLIERLSVKKVHGKIALHSTCTTTKMGLREKLLELGNLLAEEAFIPENVGCCGFAGDKGFTKPEINDWALRNLKNQVENCSGGYSNSRTCEIGLSKNSGVEYRSIFFLLEEASRKEKNSN